MINVQSVDLGSAGIVLPADKVGVVIAQPHVCLSETEPFLWPSALRPDALATIKRTLAIAREASHGLDKTHFTVLPEYSIPGVQGVQLIESELAKADWPCGAVIIGGVHALSNAEYADILSWPGSHVDELHPTEYFSQSQIQTLLLSLFLTACVSQTWSSLSPIFLDDPLTHFDDLNTYAFLDLVVGLLDVEGQGRQFVLSTCDEKFLQLARQKFRHLGDAAKFYQFSAIGADGPVVAHLA